MCCTHGRGSGGRAAEQQALSRLLAMGAVAASARQLLGTARPRAAAGLPRTEVGSKIGRWEAATSLAAQAAPFWSHPSVPVVWSRSLSSRSGSGSAAGQRPSEMCLTVPGQRALWRGGIIILLEREIKTGKGGGRRGVIYEAFVGQAGRSQHIPKSFSIIYSACSGSLWWKKERKGKKPHRRSQKPP